VLLLALLLLLLPPPLLTTPLLPLGRPDDDDEDEDETTIHSPAGSVSESPIGKERKDTTKKQKQMMKKCATQKL
jgi:hypothetical protein